MEREEDEGHGRFSRQMSERSLSRPSTPKWWRPNYPPETYEWEEMRRKRKQGGYPWTHLDKNQTERGEQGDHLYETVSPPDVYSSGLIGGDPETSSLDRHNFYIPPELDIVSSEGLDGLDEPDSHDFGMDGEKEWSLFYEDQKRSSTKSQTSTKRLFAGLRTEMPRVGETSSMRPLAQERVPSPVPLPLPNEPKVVDDDERFPLEIREEEEETPPVELEFHQERITPQEGSKVKGSPRWGLGKIALPIRPKFKEWTGIKLLKRKVNGGEKRKVRREDEMGRKVQVEVEDDPIPGPSEQNSANKLRIHFDDSFDLTLRPPSPSTPKTKTKFQPNVEYVPPVEDEENLEEIKHQAKMEQGRIREEVKRLKLEKAQREEDEKAELRRIKAEDKLTKEREKLELKRAKEEEKVMKGREEAEVKRRKEEEAEELRRKKLEEEAEAKVLKELETQELELMKMEELKVKRANEEKEKMVKLEGEQQMAETSKKDEEELKLDQLEAEIMESILKKQDKPKTPKPSKMEYFKKRLGDINCTSKRRPKRKTPHSPPKRPSPPTFKFTQSPQQELATQYRQEVRAQMEAMETSHYAPEPHILVTQPSVEFDLETHAQWVPPRPIPAQEEEDEMDEKMSRKRERKPIGQKLKGLGQRSKSVAERTSKSLKEGVSGFGKKMSAKYAAALKEMKAQEDARKAAQEERDKRRSSPSAPSTPKVVRFKRKIKNEEKDECRAGVPPPVIVGVEKKKYPQKQPPAEYKEEEFRKLDRDVLLGRGDRDWESPGGHVPSGDGSDCGNGEWRHEVVPSGWESPQCSSMTSSSANVNPHRSRGQGVLEEIDSDEFFLRERGLSEGEDEVEINRFLVKELREAFRPRHVNALSAFDTPPPPRPSRSTKRKPPEAPFQTFPPERPKRKHPPHFVSTYVESLDQQESEGEREDEEKGVPFPSDSENADEEDGMDEGMRGLRPELDQMDEEDGEYEEVNRSSPPSRPRRSKKDKPPPPPRIYYNTVRGEYWKGQDEIEIEELTELMGIRNGGQNPIPPKRNSKRHITKDSQESIKNQTNFEGNKGTELAFVDDWEIEVEDVISNESPLQAINGTIDEFEDYLEEEGSGYARVQKSPPQPPPAPAPATVPRRKRKKRENGRHGSSLKRKSREMAPPPTLIFSLPRFTPRTFHIVPPSRPHRTYSALRPKRPPRKSRGADTGYGQPMIVENEGIVRPSSRVMRDRPLPPPPRPPPRPPIPHTLNDLDQEWVERSLGVSHYANWEEEGDGGGQRVVLEEICTAKNISLLGEEEDLMGVGIQTDPLSEEDFDYNNPLGSFEEEEDVERTHKLTDSADGFGIESVDVGGEVSERPLPVTPPPTILQQDPILHQDLTPLEGSTRLIFPTRLHLEELEVDFLRVRELSARTLRMDHMYTPQLEAENVISSGTLSVGSMVSSGKFTSEDVDSVPPDSFYSLLTSGIGHGRPGEEEADPPVESIRRTPPAAAGGPGGGMVDEDVLELGIRLGRSLFRSGMRAIDAAMEFLEGALPADPESEQKQRTHLQLMLCVLLLLITGILLLTKSEPKHHHWDFYLPPTDI